MSSLAPSSPRLPSPPPPVEIQIGPKSPSGGAVANIQTTQIEQSLIDAHSKRRIHPGSKSSDMAAGPPLVSLTELDSPFQLQEHLAALHCHHTASGTTPLTRSTALQLAQPPPGIDRTLWLYELCRFLVSQCNSLIVGFLFDEPACSASTCPEMRASEWQFLCAVHEQPKSCCAIDYCCHTLDWAANVVTDQKLFPSRFAVLNDAHSKNAGVKNLVNVFRRLHRIFAHAWFQHRSVFWSVEGQTGLYVFFKSVCDLYDLLPAENYKLPPEAEGLETPAADAEDEKLPPTIMKSSSQQQQQQRSEPIEDDSLQPSSRTNTRRHIRSSPSTGSAVTTVIEADEEDNDGVSQRMKHMHISAPDVVEEEIGAEEVPVMVEPSVIEESSPQGFNSTASDTKQPGKDDMSDSVGDETVLPTTADSDEPSPNTQSADKSEVEKDTPPSQESAPAKGAADSSELAEDETTMPDSATEEAQRPAAETTDATTKDDEQAEPDSTMDASKETDKPLAEREAASTKAKESD